MAFKLFVDPTAGARSAAASIMQGAGDIADSIKERRKEKKEETKLFKANVTQAATQGLGIGEDTAERETYLQENETPDSIKGLLAGTLANQKKEQDEARTDAIQAQAAATRKDTAFKGRTENLRFKGLENRNKQLVKNPRFSDKQYEALNLSNEQKITLNKTLAQKEQNILALQGEDIQTKREQRKSIKQDYTQSQELHGWNKKKAKAFVDNVNANIRLTNKTLTQADQKQGILNMNAQSALTNSQTALLNAQTADREQKRIANLKNIDPGQLSPAHLSDGTLIPGIYLTQDKKVLQLDDPATENPNRKELASLKGVLLKLEGDPNQGLDGIPDDTYVDHDRAELIAENLHTIWDATAWMPWTSGEKTAGEWKADVRAKILELESRLGPSGTARKYDPVTGTFK